jgi:hypothetical protein
LAIFHAGGLNPSRLNRELRAFKAAWEAYLTAAFAIGMFEGEHGTELRARLTGTDDDNFFSAISECFAAWYLAGRRQLALRPRPAGRGKSCLEFSISCDGGDIKVEVKAPYSPLTDEPFWGATTVIALRVHFNRRISNLRRASAICSLSIPGSDCRSFRNFAAGN